MRNILLAVIILMSCLPRLAVTQQCRPRTFRCAPEPETCAETSDPSNPTRWTRIGDLPCADIGGVCRVAANGRASCVAP